MAKERPTTLPNGQGRVFILQALPDIRAGIAAGHSSRSLFDLLKARLSGMSYRQFCRYADRIRQTTSNPDLQAVRPKRAMAPATLDPAPSIPAQAPAHRAVEGLDSGPPPSSPPTKENTDAPKIAPRPRGFQRRPGLPNDNKDYLIGPADGSHDPATQGRGR